ncbi:MAG TPA: Nif3-like dinuclear metal center hexameric protein [Methylotenera sp.]|nr:Nif3-like dinuclear metal center hexameric protein [Methylotenera sp.]HPH06558.1 Nif3-like dinuclear metal center hexameric protein [Methylotenera sp.]HPN01887.1 Nif3-like dinuclear metal center hexameric protein [Methylotenera sp.]
MVLVQELAHYTQQLLQIERFKDYCPNGLQVEGKSEIRKIVSGVSASMALLEAAHKAKADLILVHHGYFWKNEDVRVVGIKRRRLAYLLKHDLNLMAYHLPLDAHAELGNNAQLARILCITPVGFAGESGILAYGKLLQAMPLQHFAAQVEMALQRKPLVMGNAQKSVQTVAWCTGAAQGYMEEAIALGVDVFISGEVSEQTTHLALESGVAYIAAGHHATERYGVQALGAHLAEKFNIQHEFIDIKNPV